MKKNLPGYTLFYIAAFLLYLAAIISFVGGNTSATGVLWLCLGSTFLCLGSSRARRSGEQEESRDNENKEETEEK